MRFNPDDYVSVTEAALALGVSRDTVRDELQRRGLGLLGVGYRTCMRRADFERLSSEYQPRRRKSVAGVAGRG